MYMLSTQILLLGSKDFTLLGRPLVNPEFVRVEGTVIEKTLSYTKLHFVLKKRKNYRRLRRKSSVYSLHYIFFEVICFVNL